MAESMQNELLDINKKFLTNNCGASVHECNGCCPQRRKNHFTMINTHISSPFNLARIEHIKINLKK